MKKPNVLNQQKIILEGIHSIPNFLSIFDTLLGVSFFVKDLDFCLIYANPTFYQRLGLKSQKELLGKNDFELFPEPLAKKFRKDDEWIVRKSKPMTGLVELFLNLQGIPAWYLTNKFPIMNKKDQPIGVMGTVQRYDKDNLRLTRDDKMESVIDQLRAEDVNAPSIRRLARANGMSHRQLNRRFKEATGLTPQQFMIRSRIERACEELRKTDRPLSDIAYELGFCDQSAFTSQFRKRMTLTPKKYREQYG
ncbi:AraC family transcriptional regulator [Verrucomicrobiales bacterium]|nr:AraC family transcriptional regulator [Verrucomicrobiales bacterium]MDC0049406.1 AraC family transcriptional regulator [Verrucomicrobiota bacterium]